MEQQLVSYLFRYYAHLAPLEIKANIKYSYLDAAERTEEQKKIAEYLLKHHHHEIFINKYPKCDQLARTPLARQCRYCRLHWR